MGIHRHKKGEFNDVTAKGTEINVMRMGKLKLNGEIFEPVIFYIISYEVAQVEYLQTLNYSC